MSRKRLAYIVIILAALSIPAYLLYVNWSENKFYSELENSPRAPGEITSDKVAEPVSTSQINSTPPTAEQGTKIQGEFDIYILGLAPDVLCFTPQSNTLGRFCFSNQSEAKNLLKISSAGTLGPECEQIRGQAEITYSDYIVDEYDFRRAKLTSVVRITQPAACTKTR